MWTIGSRWTVNSWWTREVCGLRVIPYESTKKNMTKFCGFLTKKHKKFLIIQHKTHFFKLNFGYFGPLLEFFILFF